jgi:hypothetical protein
MCVSVPRSITSGAHTFPFEMCVYISLKIVKEKRGEGKRKNNTGDEYDQSTLYACMEISQ